MGYSRRRNIKSLQQLAKMKDEDRKSLLRKLSDEQYKDVIRVLAMLPVLEVGTNTEVVDDEEQHVVTAGAIVTVTVTLERKTMDSLADLPLDDLEEDKEIEELDSDIVELTHEGESSEAAAITAEETEKKKTPLWRPKPQKGKKGKKGVGGGKQKAKNAKKKDAKSAGDTAEDSTNAASNMDNQANKESSDEAESSASDDDSDDQQNKAQSTVDEDDDDEAEWERLTKKHNQREKALEGKSKVSHSVHCPYFTDDKQEFWWVYLSDKKNRLLVTPPHHVTSLVEREEVELKFTAPPKPGHYTFTVNVKSDSYLGVDVTQDIKLDVHEARDIPDSHVQWEFEDEDEDENSKAEESDDEFATDDDFDDDDD